MAPWWLVQQQIVALQQNDRTVPRHGLSCFSHRVDLAIEDRDSQIAFAFLKGFCQIDKTLCVKSLWRPFALKQAALPQHRIVQMKAVHWHDRGPVSGIFKPGHKVLGECRLPGTRRTCNSDQGARTLRGRIDDSVADLFD